MPRRSAVEVAEYARARVAMYRDLYQGFPGPVDASVFRHLPVLTAERLRATPLAAQVDSLDDTQRSTTPYRLATRRSPAALVTDSDDTDSFYDEARDAFALLGIRRGESLALVTAPEQRYFAAELSDRLGYAGIRAHLVIDHGRPATHEALRALSPDLVVAAGPATSISVRADVTMRDPAHDGADIYLVAEAGLVAVRRAGAHAYRVLAGYVEIESDTAGRLIITSLLRYHQPVIRYLTPDRGRVMRGRLWLDEVAP